MQTNILGAVIESTVTLFARGGGGGSGGGGDGGSILILIGYLPAYFTTKTVNKKLGTSPAYIAGSVVGLLVTMVMFVLSPGLGIITLFAAAFGVWQGTHDFMAKLLRKAKRAKKTLKHAASQDPYWQEANLEARVRQVFTEFQQDWSKFNLENMKNYLSPRYTTHIHLMMIALHQMGRRNEVTEPTIKQLQIVDAVDHADNEHDAFSVLIEASAHDTLIDTKTNETIFTDKSSFEELWHFDRENNSWMLEAIDQATADGMKKIPALESFAHERKMFYSLDWGWLLLPKRGQLFSKAQFGKSDINNHVIGAWGTIIVQLYTYIPSMKNAENNNYLIGQINLPKGYGGIIIKRKTKGLGWFQRKPRGYQKVSMEWPDFNKRYSVYATDVDQVTAFELLNPKFMADLYDKNLHVDIEVVDNLVYLFTKVAKGPRHDKYSSMLDILTQAHKELKL